jgi:hypothetical protein
LKKEVRIAINDLILEKSGNPTSFYSLKRIVPTLENKILWVHDKNDKITPLSDMESLMIDQLSHVEFIITEGFGHSRIYKEKEVIGSVIAFITGDPS